MSHPDQDCPHCQALEAKVAELERRLAERGGPGHHPEPLSSLSLKALRTTDQRWGEGWVLRPSPVRRHWMTEQPIAYRCLPMVVANQWGWQVLCPTDVRVAWDGRVEPEGLRVDVDPQWALPIASHFGLGIVTFTPPWVFRTAPGWDLYAKGPSNRWKPNCAPLEGIIETWWLNYPFTLNWKLVEPGVVYFRKGESLAQLVPVPHGTFLDATAVEAPIVTAEPKAAAELKRWLDERRRILHEPTTIHKLYHKAEDIEGHLVKIPVPPVVPTWGGPGPAPTS
jgi:hypothetical protein